jgi:CheY-like chemotaxis protein/Flp pilus assembly protein TadD
VIEYQDKTALVIDDYPNMRSAFRTALAAFSLTKVDMAATAAEASSRAKNCHYDIIICDYNLGDNRDGQQLLEEMRHQGLIGLETAFLMVTAESLYERVVAAAELAPDDYLIKPFNADIMRSRLDSILAKKEVFAPVYIGFGRGDLEAALAGCDTLMQNQPKYRVDAMRFKGEVLIAMGRFDEASVLYDEIVRLRAVPWARLGLARTLHLRNKSAEAEALLTDLVDQHPELVPAYDLLADTQVAQDKLLDAQYTLQRGVTTSAKSTLRQRRLGEVAYLNGDLKTATTAFDATVQKGKYSVFQAANDFANLSRVYLDQGDIAGATRVLQDNRKRLQENDDGKLVSAVMMGLVHSRTGNVAEAERQMKEAVRLRDNGTSAKPELLLDMAEGCLKAGLAEEAAALVGEVARNAHDSEALLDKAKRIYAEVGQEESAHDVIKAATEHVVRLSKEGALLAQRGDLVSATRQLFLAVKEAPRNPRVLMNAAWVAMRLVEEDPDHSQYLAQVRLLLDDAAHLAPEHPRLGGLQTKLRAVEAAVGIKRAPAWNK